MSQIRKNRDGEGVVNVYIPKNSTSITSGDILVMPRKADPRSRARLGALNRVSPIATADSAPWVVGVAMEDFTSTTVGSTLYAAPTSNQAVPVYKTGVVKLAISNTSGNAGDMVIYASGATGAQVFSISNKLAGFAIGTIEKTFSGASANDVQDVRLIPKDELGIDMAYYLENRRMEDCTLMVPTAAKNSTVAIGRTLTGNRMANAIIIQGKRFKVARNSQLNIGKLTGGAVSAFKARLIVGRSATIGFRTCSGTAIVATYNTAGVTAAVFTPVTQTSGEIAIGYVVVHSGHIKVSAGRIAMVDGPSGLPVTGNKWTL